MPSDKVLEQKRQVVEELISKFKSACVGVLVDYKGINVEADTKLRKELREAGVDYFVAKNTLIRFAAKETNLSELENVLEGTTSIALHESDYTAAARILSKYANDKTTEFSIKSGFIDGEVVSVDQMNVLAKLPSKEVLIAQVLGGFNAPISGFARVINAIKEKREAEEEVA